jgi:predicted ATP-grasp superfamily ATP-dependent carboligase
VLIFGAHITALGVLRALAARGIPCYVVDNTTDVILSRSRWYRSPGRTLAETTDSSELADYLLSLDLERAVLIACSDRWALAVAGLPADVRERFAASASGRDTVEQLTDKNLFGALVSRLNIPHPGTVDINSPADLEQVTDEQLVNGFLKPTFSQLHWRVFGTKGSFVNSREAAVRRVEEATALGIEFVLQEWIPGKHSASILMDGLVDRDGAIRALTARRRVREDPPRLGTTASSVGIPLEGVAEAVDAVKRLLAEISYRGIFNIEFKFDSRDGHYKIIEFNARPCWYTGTIASAGVDLPWMAYLDAQDLPVPEARRYPTGCYALYEFADAKAIMRAMGSRRRPEGPVLRTWLTGDRALFWWKDPMPAVGGAGQALGRRVGRLFGRSRRAPMAGSNSP